jgi:hypothetical protein
MDEISDRDERAEADRKSAALLRRLMELVPEPDAAASSDGTWTVRRKGDFDTSDLYGDP